jgi:hypothetical protein
MTDDPNPFHGCDTDEIFALTFDLEGRAGLQALLAEVDLDKEDLSGAADRLQAAGLIEAADIIRDASKQAETRSSREIAIVLREEDPIRQKADFARLYRQGAVSMADLEAQGVDDDTLAYIEKSRQPRRARR